MQQMQYAVRCSLRLLDIDSSIRDLIQDYSRYGARAVASSIAILFEVRSRVMSA